MPTSFHRLLCISTFAVALSWTPLEAQSPSRIDLVTVSPLGWPDGRLDAEWLFCGFTENGRADCGLRSGLRATTGRADFRTRGAHHATTRRYRELDAVIRLDPSLDEGADPSRWSVGLRAGLLHVDGSLPSPGIGVDVDRTWAFRRRLLIVAGVGMKGLLIVDRDPTFAAIPAARLAIGWMF